MNQSLKYSSYTVACQEVPNEISLIINVSGCPNHCEGCHSPHLWEYEGNSLSEDIQGLIERYSSMFTCVCFMGGDQNMDELNSLLKTVRDNGLKTCVYSGSTNIDLFTLELLDYLKLGRYMPEFGGLDDPHSNQRFYSIADKNLTNKTHLFQRKEKVSL